MQKYDKMPSHFKKAISKHHFLLEELMDFYNSESANGTSEPTKILKNANTMGPKIIYAEVILP